MSLASFAGELSSMALAVAGKGALISLAALGAAVALRRASASSRHLVLAFAAAALLLLPVLAATLPAWRLAVLPAVETRHGPTPAAAAPPGVQTPGSHEKDRPRGDAALAPPPLGVGFFLRSQGFQSLAGALAIAILLLIRLCVALCRLSRLRAGSRPAPAEWLEPLDQQRRRLGIARPVRLAVSAAVAVPVTFGWRRPVVLLPEAALGWEEDPLREALVHELSHVRRCDWPVQVMARAACALHWFDPLVRLLCRRLLLEAELACDDQVLQAGAGAEGYAERLVALARQVRARRPAAAVAFARPSGLASRIASLLDSGRRRGGPGRLAVAAVAAAALVLLLLVAPAHLVRAASPSKAETRSLEQRHTATSTFPVSDLPPLLRAAWEGNLGEVRRLLAAGADPNQAVPRLGTPLILAATQGHRDVVEALLAAGADPALVEGAGERPVDLQRSPLGAAARQGDLEVVRWLLGAAAPVDLAPRGDATPLMNAAERGHRDVVEALLDAGADPKAVVRGDGTPLIAAARGGDPDVVRRLLATGADPDVYVPGDETALQQAIENGHAEAARVLLDAGAAPLTGEALEDAVEQGVSGALEDGSLWEGLRDGIGEGRREALIEAAAGGDTEAVRFFLQKGVDPNTVVPGDGTPLIAAARAGQPEVVRLLLTAGAHVDQVVPGDENPLIQAAWNGRLEVARLLLEAGADPNVRVVANRSAAEPDGELRTPLRMARRGGHQNLEELLLEYGAKD